ncbi:uracil-DNA glycosylase family protein [Haladaptatus pallidirubidus]|uniref:Type-4 uracil-DNA glycosylase n=1 Tax=Haladaptatus pallidirubidus TaxID=1008152 RepID=A0AAV3UFV5_9EURY|nr:uracil-DNA glycosylase [Haladaptatus pallidirubidus]
MGTMEGLEVTECERCPSLVDCRQQIVNGTGSEDADLLFVGEGPGANEDEQGEPFVGRSGSVLDDKLRDEGLSRADVRITNCVRCRPPENRDPTKTELSNCREYLNREIELVNPDVIVTLGKVPSEHLLDRNVAVTSEAGTTVNTELGGKIRDVLICVHPAATLYDRSQESTFESAIGKAANMAESSGGQSSLGEF